jgi:hypothetical protein
MYHYVVNGELCTHNSSMTVCIENECVYCTCSATFSLCMHEVSLDGQTVSIYRNIHYERGYNICNIAYSIIIKHTRRCLDRCCYIYRWIHVRSKIVYVQNLLPNVLHSGFAEPSTQWHEETNTGREQLYPNAETWFAFTLNWHTPHYIPVHVGKKQWSLQAYWKQQTEIYIYMEL